MSEQAEFESFHPSVARAIALARDERVAIETPRSKPAPPARPSARGIFELIPVTIDAIISTF